MPKFGAMSTFAPGFAACIARTRSSRASSKPLVPTTAWIPRSMSHSRLSITASGWVKSTTQSAPCTAFRSSLASTPATSSMSSAARTAATTSDPMRPSAPKTPTLNTDPTVTEARAASSQEPASARSRPTQEGSPPGTRSGADAARSPKEHTARARRRHSSADRQHEGEVVVGVCPPVFGGETGRPELLGEPFAPELRGDLGEHFLALGEVHGQVDAAHAHRLVPARAQPHLDPLLFGVPPGHVVERAGVEVGAQFPVDDGQNVAVEGGGDPLGVVVGGNEAFGVLDQVAAEQEPVTGVQHLVDLTQEHRAALGDLVSDGGPQDGQEPAPAALRDRQE